MRYLGLHELAFSRSRGRLLRADTAIGWTQLNFSWKFFEPALPHDLCSGGFVGTPTCVNAGLSRGDAAERCGFLHRKEPHV